MIFSEGTSRRRIDGSRRSRVLGENFARSVLFGKAFGGPEKLFTLPEKSLIPPPIKRGLHGEGLVHTPRNEQKGLSKVVADLFSFKHLQSATC
jgi:hypothetical protein